MEAKGKSEYKEESEEFFIPSFGNLIPATYTYSRKGIKDSNEKFILKIERSSVVRGKTTLTCDKGKIMIDRNKSSTLYNICNENDDLYATMQFLTKNKVEIETHGETYYGKKKLNQKQIERIDKDRNVCISIPITYTYSQGLQIEDFPISSNGSLSPELGI